MHARRRVIACTSAVALIAALAAACGGAKHASTPTAESGVTTIAGSATAVPPTATPTLPPPSSNAAATLATGGEFEQASRVYAAIAATATPGAVRQDALLQQAQLLVRAGRGADARPVLESYLAAAGAFGGDGRVARYMLASTLDDLGDAQGALDSYERYIAGDGTLADFARLERAKLLARSGLGVDPEPLAEAVLASNLLPDFKASFLLSMGKAFDAGHDDARALAWYARAVDGGDTASALARIATIKKRDGDGSWIADASRVITSYPSSGAAAELLDELDAAAVPVDDFSRGIVDYRAFRNAAARDALTRAAGANDHAAEATYYLGALDERAGDPTAAIGDYRRSYELDATTSVADDALWWRARLLETAKRFDEAGAVYDALIAGFPSSTWTGDARFRRGLVLYEAGAYKPAADAWSAITTSKTDIDEQLRARFWQGRALMQANDPLGKSVLELLSSDKDAAGNFYALRADVLLNKNVAKDNKPKLDAAVDWKKLDAWITQATGIDPNGTTVARRSWAVVDDLRTVGLTAQADAVARSYISADDYDPLLLYGDLRAAHDANNVSLTARIAATMIASLAKDAPAPPDDLQRLSYPAAFGDLTSAAASDEGISPLLLLSLVRQESFYDPDAGSGAGALGLTQVVPATGQSIADGLGVASFVANDLFRPKTSLRFGANYLASQLKEFDGNAYQALAAYNGGPGTAANAIEASTADDDLFVANLEFDETNLYVRLVMQNYARYRQLFAGVDRPSLPN